MGSSSIITWKNQKEKKCNFRTTFSADDSIVKKCFPRSRLYMNYWKRKASVVDLSTDGCQEVVRKGL